MEELTAFTASLPAIEMRAPYEQLSAQVDEGEVPVRLVPALERVLEICLETGRARRIHGPQGEMTLWQLFQRTPRVRRCGARLTLPIRRWRRWQVK